MTFPAWFDLHCDKAVTANPSALRVYAFLIANYPRIFFEPQDVKAWLIAETEQMGRDSVNDSLDLLVARGYILDHGRGQNNVRRLTLTITRVQAVALK